MDYNAVVTIKQMVLEEFSEIINDFFYYTDIKRKVNNEDFRYLIINGLITKDELTERLSDEYEAFLLEE